MDNKEFWDEIVRKYPRPDDDPDPWTSGEVSVLVVSAVALLAFLGVILMGWL